MLVAIGNFALGILNIRLRHTMQKLNKNTVTIPWPRHTCSGYLCWSQLSVFAKEILTLHLRHTMQNLNGNTATIPWPRHTCSGYLCWSQVSVFSKEGKTHNSLTSHPAKPQHNYRDNTVTSRCMVDSLDFCRQQLLSPGHLAVSRCGPSGGWLAVGCWLLKPNT